MTKSSFGYELAGIASGALQGAVDRRSVIDAVGALFDADSAALIRPTGDGRLCVAHAHGYSGEVLHLMTSPRLLARDPGIRSLNTDHSRRPIRWWRDIDYRYETSLSATEYLIPEGYSGGVSMRFRLPTGLHIGDIHVSTRRALTPSLAQLEELESGWSTLAATVHREQGAAFVVDDREFTADLEGMSSSDAASVREVLLSTGEHHRGSYSFRFFSADQRWYRVDVLDHGENPHVCARIDDLPAGITARELSVLDLMCVGLTNAEIGHALFLSERTVAHNVERILMKLDAPSRTGAAVIAIDHGLRLTPPRPLHQH